MNNNTNPNTTLDEVKNLISYSIYNFDSEENSNYNLMHRAIIKKYFDARDL